MKKQLLNVKLIIVDEISMVSSLNLAFMHLRLEELFGGDEWFGNRNMLFVGDILQLQPVSGNPVFEKITQKSLLHKLGCAAYVNIWRDSVVYDELTINERQKSDAEFAAMLDCVRRGCPTDETICCLEKRVVQVSVSSMSCLSLVSHLYASFLPEKHAKSLTMKCSKSLPRKSTKSCVQMK